MKFPISMPYALFYKGQVAGSGNAYISSHATLQTAEEAAAKWLTDNRSGYDVWISVPEHEVTLTRPPVELSKLDY